MEVFLVLLFYVKLILSLFYYYYIVGCCKYVYINFFKLVIKIIYVWCVVDFFCFYNLRMFIRYEEVYVLFNLYVLIVLKCVMFLRCVVKCFVKYLVVWIISDY